MEKAKFVISGDNLKQVSGAIYDAARTSGVTLFSWDGERRTDPVSLLDILPKQSLERLESAFKDLERLQARVDADDDSIDTKAIIKVLGIANRYRLLERGKDGGLRAEDGPLPKGFLLPLTANPKRINLTFGDGIDVAAEPVVDVKIGFADNGAPAQVHRAPGLHGGPTFLRRSEALRSIGHIKDQNRNQQVHVYVVDQGMDEDHVNMLGGEGTWGGIVWDGTAPTPRQLPLEHADRYRTRPQWHAHMIVRNILEIAGDNRDVVENKRIKIYDVPVIPDRVYDVVSTANQISHQYAEILNRISTMDANDRAVVVNAWGVKNRLREDPLGRLTESKLHTLNAQIEALARFPNSGNPRAAIVFAAGNTGLFTPDPEAGPYDRGPRRSVWLPAALPMVWNVGASDANGMWIGASSQGPHVGGGTAEQPDFNVPSYFREDLDAHILNTGSSASCGVLAGMIVAHWRMNNGPPSKPGARGNAKKKGFTGHSNRLGHGIPQHLKLE